MWSGSLLEKTKAKQISKLAELSHSLKCSLLLFQPFLCNWLCHWHVCGHTVRALLVRTSHDVVVPPSLELGRMLSDFLNVYQIYLLT